MRFPYRTFWARAVWKPHLRHVNHLKSKRVQSLTEVHLLFRPSARISFWRLHVARYFLGLPGQSDRDFVRHAVLETSYDGGPVLVGAKLNAVGEMSPGEGGVPLLERNLDLPNDEFALYDEGDFRIRVLTTGGFSPDGLTALRPDMYEQFFRVHTNGADGETVLLEKVGEEYAVAGGTLRVVGISTLILIVPMALAGCRLLENAMSYPTSQEAGVPFQTVASIRPEGSGCLN